MATAEFGVTQALPEYQQLRKAFAQRKLPLTIVCGAGLSMVANLPNWQGLRQRLEESAKSKVSSLNQMGQQLYDAKLRAALSSADMWVAFDLLNDVLSPPVFTNIIVEELTPSLGTRVPEGYEALMKLKPRGLVTLNLDKFAGEALASVNLGKVVTPVYGLELASKWNIIRDAPQYVVYLHGEVNDPSNWVLTKTQLDKLFSSGAQQHFLTSLYAGHIVLFAGVSVDDIALSSRLLEMRREGFRPPALYWLTTRLDPETLRWAGENYISVINYRVGPPADHGAFLNALADDLLTFIPVEEPSPLPILTQSKHKAVDAPTEAKALAQLAPEEIRVALSQSLQSLIASTPHRALYHKFQDFCRAYRYPINRAFYKDDDPEFSVWFGLKLHFPPLGRGNFGEVFLSEQGDGAQTALKIMHYSILDDTNMLGGFRRGIRSMNFLSEAGIDGIAKIIDSYELPPTIIMEYIPGVTLQDALESRPNLPWIIKLSIILKISSIVHSSHSLAMTVLHRDLKPSNIMIRNFEYTGLFNPEVVVLDFDMSWHKGSNEKDVVFESRDDFGYLSPEQTTSIRGISTISTRVDSYGLGMTAFYLFGSKHPRPNEGLSDDWYRTALRATKTDYDGKWKSAPHRLARIIRDTTKIAQADRMDFSVAFRELQTLHAALMQPQSVSNPEFWAEEVIANLPSPAEYIWNAEGPHGEIRLERGVIVKSQPNFRKDRVELIFEFQFQGAQHYSRLTQKIDAVPSKMRLRVESCGWRWESYDRGQYQARLNLAIDVSSLISNPLESFGGASDTFRLFENIVLS